MMYVFSEGRPSALDSSGRGLEWKRLMCVQAGESRITVIHPSVPGSDSDSPLLPFFSSTRLCLKCRLRSPLRMNLSLVPI